MPTSDYRSTLKAHSDFKQVYSSRLRLYRNGLVFYYRRADELIFRYAISISKRYGKAVKRNKLRRRLKEIIRMAKTLPLNSELIIGINSKCEELSFSDLQTICHWAFDKISKKPLISQMKASGL